jgi:hypothetical protein
MKQVLFSNTNPLENGENIKLPLEKEEKPHQYNILFKPLYQIERNQSVA